MFIAALVEEKILFFHILKKIQRSLRVNILDENCKNVEI